MFLDYLDPIDREIIEHHKFEEKEIRFLLVNEQREIFESRKLCAENT